MKNGIFISLICGDFFNWCFLSLYKINVATKSWQSAEVESCTRSFTQLSYSKSGWRGEFSVGLIFICRQESSWKKRRPGDKELIFKKKRVQINLFCLSWKNSLSGICSEETWGEQLGCTSPALACCWLWLLHK